MDWSRKYAGAIRRPTRTRLLAELSGVNVLEAFDQRCALCSGMTSLRGRRSVSARAAAPESDAADEFRHQARRSRRRHTIVPAKLLPARKLRRRCDVPLPLPASPTRGRSTYLGAPPQSRRPGRSLAPHHHGLSLRREARRGPLPDRRARPRADVSPRVCCAQRAAATSRRRDRGPDPTEGDHQRTAWRTSNHKRRSRPGRLPADRTTSAAMRLVRCAWDPLPLPRMGGRADDRRPEST